MTETVKVTGSLPPCRSPFPPIIRRNDPWRVDPTTLDAEVRARIPKDVQGLPPGAFGALRDRGRRRHLAVDLEGEAGQLVTTWMELKPVRESRPYRDDLSFGGWLLEDRAGRLWFVWYLEPIDQGRVWLPEGTPIGLVQTLGGRYPGIRDHVHFMAVDPGRTPWDHELGQVLDPTPFLTRPAGGLV